MGTETKNDVLQWLRYQKSESTAGNLIAAGVLGYLLITRSSEALAENALFALFALVSVFQIVGVGVVVFNRKLPSVWDILFFTGGTVLSSATLVLFIYGGVSIAVDSFNAVSAFWANLDPLKNRGQFIGVTGLMTVTVGSLFFVFRLKQRFLYGFLETCVGVAVGMHRVTLEIWPVAPTSAAFYLALLTAGIYLVVESPRVSWRPVGLSQNAVAV